MVIQYSQINTLNYYLKEERFSLLKLSLYCLLSGGLYLIYFEYLKAKALEEITKTTDDTLSTFSVAMSVIALSIVFDIILQEKINDHILTSESLEFTLKSNRS